MSSKPSRLQRFLIAGALLAAPVIALGPTPSASAVSVTSTTSGTPGAVSFPGGPMLVGVDAQVQTQSGPADTLGLMTTGITVGASPDSHRAQKVQVRLAFQKMAGTWWTFQAMETSLVVRDSDDVAFGQFQVNRQEQFLDYRIMYTVTWTDAETGAVIAQAMVEPSTTGDTRCIAVRATCNSYGDRIRS